jgi:hypothetical protein
MHTVLLRKCIRFRYATGVAKLSFRLDIVAGYSSILCRPNRVRLASPDGVVYHCYENGGVFFPVPTASNVLPGVAP